MKTTQIQLLPEALANQIAAGEVVQRPASAVKELLENALDAQATHIRLAVQDAGKKLIQVVDNGSGMLPADARMCFERHATSKIRKLDDLFCILTMGFRGEAMASIAAVAQVEMLTRPAEEELGTRIAIAGGELQSQEPTPTAVGTVVSVRNLFFNVPARRNFLKSNPVELRHILTEFYHVALARPDVHFVFDNNNSTELDLFPATQEERFIQLHNQLSANDLQPMGGTYGEVTVGGFLGLPQVARKTRGQQYIFVNGRFIRSGLLHHAITTGYGETLSPGHHPAYLLTLQLDPRRIDINIHPTKTEIQFEDERELYACVLDAVRQALGGLPAAALHRSPGEGDSPQADAPESQGMLREIYAAAQRPSADSTTLAQFRARQDHKLPDGFDWRTLYPEGKTTAPDDYNPVHNPATAQAAASAAALPPPAGLFPHTDSAAPCTRISPRYLSVAREDGLYLVDIERAHRRVLYEQYLNLAQRNQLSVQQLLYPLQLSFDKEDFLLLKEALPELHRMGFQLTVSPDQVLHFRGTPFASMTEDELRLLLDGLLDLLKESGELEDTVRETVARSLARRQGISTRQYLPASEIAHLARELFACLQPAYSPSGEPVWHFTRWADIDKLFEKR